MQKNHNNQIGNGIQSVNDIIYNPCAVCVKAYGYKNITGVNDACYRSCWRNAGILQEGVNTVQFNECFRNCQRCSQILVAANGKNPCEVRYVQPPFWIQPNYFKQGMDKYGNIEQAYKYCNMKCDSQECKNNCFIDYYSIYNRNSISQNPNFYQD